MAVGSIGYSELNLGLNNQKLALLGLVCKAAVEKHTIALPRFSLFNPNNQEHPTVDFGDVFDRSVFQKFLQGFGLELVQGPPDITISGWDCFLQGGGHIGRDALRGFAAINDLVCQFFNHLVPHVIQTSAFSQLSHMVYRKLGIQCVIQLRIEKDWIQYADSHLRAVSQPGEDYLPSFLEILQKVKNTTEIPCNTCYAVCDESNLPVSKEYIRDEVKSRFGISLVWKSDILPASQLSELSILELALTDFEMAVRAKYFIGLSRSSFSDLALFETFCRTRKQVSTHYIYNLPGPVLGRRTDNASQIIPTLVVNKLFQREPLIVPLDEDCLWPATLTAHISQFGDFRSESGAIAGVRGGLLVCGCQGGENGHLIEGFSLELGSGAPVDVEYRALLDDATWTPWVRSSMYVGTRGENRQIAGFAAKVVGRWSGRFQCYYAGSFSGHAGIVTGSAGTDCCVEGGAKLAAMQIVFRPVTHNWA